MDTVQGPCSIPGGGGSFGSSSVWDQPTPPYASGCFGNLPSMVCVYKSLKNAIHKQPSGQRSSFPALFATSLPLSIPMLIWRTDAALRGMPRGATRSRPLLARCASSISSSCAAHSAAGLAARPRPSQSWHALPTKGEVVKLAPTTFDRCGRWFESQCRHTLSVLGGFG